MAMMLNFLSPSIMLKSLNKSERFSFDDFLDFLSFNLVTNIISNWMSMWVYCLS